MKSANENVIRALARALVEARAGNIEAVVIIAASPDGVPDVTFGGETELVPSLNLGLDLYKHRLVQQASARVEMPVTPIRRAIGEAN